MKLLALVAGLLLFFILNPQTIFADETNAQMNELIRAIHNDLLILKANYPCLSNYSDSCIWKSDGHSRILYTLPFPTVVTKVVTKGLPTNSCINNLPQMPDQISINYISNDAKHIKNLNDFESVGACQFPAIKSKLIGVVIMRGPENAKLEKLVKQIVEAECTKLQDKIQSRKSD